MTLLEIVFRLRLFLDYCTFILLYLFIYLFDNPIQIVSLVTDIQLQRTESVFRYRYSTSEEQDSLHLARLAFRTGGAEQNKTKQNNEARTTE